MSDFTNGNGQGNGNGLGRRGAIGVGASVGLALVVDSMLAGCKTRDYNAKTKDTATGRPAKPLTAFAPEFLAPVPLMDIYDRIVKESGSFDDPIVPGPDGTPLTLGQDSHGPLKIQALLKFLILVRIKVAPTKVFDELIARGIKVLNPTIHAPEPLRLASPASLAPILVVSHTGVVRQILDRGNTISNPDLHPADSLKIAAGAKINRFRLLPYHPEMPFLVGHFMLCDDDVERHDYEKDYVQSKAMPAADETAAKFVAIVRKHAEALVAEALEKPAFKERREIDVVQDLARWLPVRVVRDYFGIPSGPDAPGFSISTEQEAKLFDRPVGTEIKPSEQQMFIWIANSFRNLFLNLAKDQNIAKYGRKSGSQLLWYIAKNVEKEEKAGKDKQSDTMVGRLVRSWISNKSAKIFNSEMDSKPLDLDGKGHPLAGVVEGPVYRISSQVAGAVAGAGVTVEEAIARVFNVLLDPVNAGPLADAIKTAKGGDYKALRGFYKEALRFQPQAELLPRVAAEATEVEGEKIPKGALVFASLYGAMHDDTYLASKGKPAKEFQAGRPDDCYLEFGFGRNECLGRYIAPLEIVEAMRAVFRRVEGGLQKAGDLKFGPDAPLEDNADLTQSDFKGPYMHSLVVKFL